MGGLEGTINEDEDSEGVVTSLRVLTCFLICSKLSHPLEATNLRPRVVAGELMIEVELVHSFLAAQSMDFRLGRRGELEVARISTSVLSILSRRAGLGLVISDETESHRSEASCILAVRSKVVDFLGLVGLVTVGW